MNHFFYYVDTHELIQIYKFMLSSTTFEIEWITSLHSFYY